MAKKITGYIKLQVPAGIANPSPPIGPALGQRGVNIMEFCKAFNAATQELEKGAPIPTVITVYADRSFSFTTKTPPASFLLKKAANLKSGSKEPGKVSAGTIKPLEACRDRRGQDEGPQRQRHRGGDEDHRRLRSRDGPPGGGGLSDGEADQEAEGAGRFGRPREVLRGRRGARAGEAERDLEVRRDRRSRAQPGRRSAPRRPDGPRRRQPARRARARPSASPSSPRARRPRKPRRPAPTSSAPRT